MRKVKVFCFLLITIFFLHSKVYSQEVEFVPHTIVGGEVAADGAYSVYAIDVDDDGDMDVLSASSNDDKITWYENSGDGNFNAHTITTSADASYSVYAADVDCDGDMDVLSASFLDNKIAWYENDGDENFSAHTITTSAIGAWSVYTADVDDDGDMDVLSASFEDNKIAWYENDGDQNFNAHTITTNAIGAISVYAADVDDDRDMDVLSASWNDDKIIWYENDGDGNFNAHTITTSADGARSVYATDVDGDGDMDVLSASYYDNKIAWYENLQITGINEDNNLIIKFNNLNNFPNPFNPTTTISYQLPEDSEVELIIYNIKGQKVKTLVHEVLPAGNNSVIWNGDDDTGKSVGSEIYFYKLKAGDFQKVRKMILLK